MYVEVLVGRGRGGVASIESRLEGPGNMPRKQSLLVMEEFSQKAYVIIVEIILR